MRLFKFLVSGGSAAAVEFGVFLLLHELFGNQGLIASQTISFLVGFVVSFTLNKLWVFKSDGKILHELTKYIVLLSINLVITNVLISVLVNLAGIEYWVAKIILMAMVAAWNYILFQKIVFRKKTI